MHLGHYVLISFFSFNGKVEYMMIWSRNYGSDSSFQSQEEGNFDNDTPNRVSDCMPLLINLFGQQIEVAREVYFDQQSSKCVTSDRTLSDLDVPRMDQQVPNWN